MNWEAKRVIFPNICFFKREKRIFFWGKRTKIIDNSTKILRFMICVHKEGQEIRLYIPPQVLPKEVSEKSLLLLLSPPSSLTPVMYLESIRSLD